MTTETTRYGRLNAAVDATQARTGLPREAVLSAFVGAMAVHVGEPTWGDCLAALGRLYAKPWDCCEHCERESGVCVDTVGREHTAPCPECAPPDDARAAVEVLGFGGVA